MRTRQDHTQTGGPRLTNTCVDTPTQPVHPLVEMSTIQRRQDHTQTWGPRLTKTFRDIPFNTTDCTTRTTLDIHSMYDMQLM